MEAKLGWANTFLFLKSYFPSRTYVYVVSNCAPQHVTPLIDAAVAKANARDEVLAKFNAANDRVVVPTANREALMYWNSLAASWK